MPTDTALSAPSATFGTPVELTAIARELKKLWQADQTRTRASLINFAIICEGEDAMRDSTELLERFVRNHSFHALLIGINPHAAETSVQAWINANCYLPKAGAKHVCCEQVTIFVQGKVRELLPNLIFSQLDYDLPLTLWWRCECPEQVDAEIWRWVDRLIFDSGTWKNPRAQFAAMRKALAVNRSAHDASSRTVLGDLNWVRTGNLRQAIAQIYDLPGGAVRLRKLRSLDISHGRGSRTTALLFLGWFATLLGWKNATPSPQIASSSSQPSTLNSQLSFTSADGTPIPCELSESSGAPIHRVILDHDDVSITVDHPAHAEYLNLTLVWKDGRLTRHLVPADSTDLADILDEELSRGSRHGIYLRALAAAEALM
jgi:glucose-6-phosphate dehydrogenase assembly protein OpcA